MTKVVINRKYGGFDLSDQAHEMYLNIAGRPFYEYEYYAEHKRSDQALVKTVELLGEKANTEYSFLVVVEVPSDASWHIEDHDGIESIHENHRVWQ